MSSSSPSSPHSAGIDLNGKAVVIIGGTSGLGRSAARACVRAGARIVVVGRQPEKIDETVAELGGAARGLAADASDPASAVQAIDMSCECHGGFDGLYHVAGGSGRKQGDGVLHEISDEGWNYTLDLNLTSLFYSNRAAVRRFLERGGGGVILNMGSVLGWSPAPRYFATHAYTAAKAAIIGMTRAAAATYASDKIRCNVVAPALVETPMAMRAAENEEILEYIATKQPLDGGRIGRPEDLDAAVVYLLSDASRFVTGHVLTVDGGWTVSEGQHAEPKR